jgi:adenylate kinase
VKKVIYLTGAPASGKTTTVRQLLQSRQDIELWAYSSRLRDYIKNIRSEELTHEGLRQESATVVRPEDVVAVDTMLVDFISENRTAKHVIIDSHPVTKEDYGFRCTAFSTEQIQTLAPDEIWVLYTDPQTTIDRICEDGGGRKTPSIEDARMHTSLQASVATSYGISVGRPVYLFDSTSNQNDLVSRLSKRLS